MRPKDLPVYQQRRRILDELKDNQVIVIESPTGSGKTTQLPLILHRAGYGRDGLIGVTQPRRIAAVSVSDYIASQLNEKVPGTVGYKMRFEDQTSLETRIKIMTDGILLQELKHDNLLSGYSVIMVDEAHERSLNIDFILGLLKQILESRPEFKVIISSATINAEIFSTYFNGCPIVHIDTPMYPVQIVYDSPAAAGGLTGDEALLDKIESIVERTIASERTGDILIFLSGEKIIKDCLYRLNSSRIGRKLHILPLYGRLSKEEQELVFDPPPAGKIKVVISTNIAETSVTIDGITTVIDSGLAKMNYYNPRTFTSSLIEGPISKASCNQRRGRAGRTGPGMCYRLYSKKDFDHRELFTLEEIYRTDLSEVILRMADLGIRDFDDFNFISPPGAQGIRGAVETLLLLDALDQERRLTSVGTMMVQFPLIPRHSRIIVEAILRYPQVLEEVLIAASFLSTHTPFLLPPGEELEARHAHHRFSDPAGDFISYLKLFRGYLSQREGKQREEFCRRHYLDYKVMNEILNIKLQLEEIVSLDLGVPISHGGSTKDYLCAVSSGLLQFVCQRSGKTSYRSLTADKIQIHPGSVMFRESPQFIVAGEIVRTSRMFARSVSPLERSWLPEISEQIAKHFGGAEKRGDGKKETKKKRDTGWEIKLGDEIFKLEPYKKSKKMAVLPWEQISRVIAQTSKQELKIHDKLRAKIVYRDYEIHTGDQLGSILKIVPYLDPESDLTKTKNGKIKTGSFSTLGGDIAALCDKLDHLLRLVPGKKNSKTLGFYTLQSDGAGNYWFKVIRSFHTAVDVSLSSLETLADELGTAVEASEIDKVNRAYRRLLEIYESY
ncbi:MAG TPA: ATP-dependent RNA helicase [Sediminispirochaeta sp.]|nr:ATP-dependent RNA helicase [Sediminispirochaeta sp.]